MPEGGGGEGEEVRRGGGEIQIGKFNMEKDFMYCWWEHKLKSAWRFPGKLKIDLPYVPAVLLLAMCPRVSESASTGALRPHVYHGPFHERQGVDSAYAPTYH